MKSFRQRLSNPGAMAALLALLLYALVPATGAVSKGVRIHDARAPAPPLHALGIPGDLLAGADKKGKVIVVNFWATWCAPCKAEMPSMDRLYRKLQDQGLAMLAIAMGDTDETIRDFQARAREPVSFPLIAGNPRRLAEHWRVSTVPMSYILDRRGQIAISITGEMDWQSTEIVEPVRRLLAEPTEAQP